MAVVRSSFSPDEELWLLFLDSVALRLFLVLLLPVFSSEDELWLLLFDFISLWLFFGFFFPFPLLALIFAFPFSSLESLFPPLFNLRLLLKSSFELELASLPKIFTFRFPALGFVFVSKLSISSLDSSAPDPRLPQSMDGNLKIQPRVPVNLNPFWSQRR